MSIKVCQGSEVEVKTVPLFREKMLLDALLRKISWTEGGRKNRRCSHAPVKQVDKSVPCDLDPCTFTDVPSIFVAISVRMIDPLSSLDNDGAIICQRQEN